jgi:hypothetical protein
LLANKLALCILHFGPGVSFAENSRPFLARFPGNGRLVYRNGAQKILSCSSCSTVLQEKTSALGFSVYTQFVFDVS